MPYNCLTNCLSFGPEGSLVYWMHGVQCSPLFWRLPSWPKQTEPNVTEGFQENAIGLKGIGAIFPCTTQQSKLTQSRQHTGGSKTHRIIHSLLEWAVQFQITYHTSFSSGGDERMKYTLHLCWKESIMKQKILSILIIYTHQNYDGNHKRTSQDMHLEM